MYEIFKEDFSRHLYVDADEETVTLTQNISTHFAPLKVEANSISLHDGKIYLAGNKNYNLQYKQNLEDGFLFYRFKVEIKPN